MKKDKLIISISSASQLLDKFKEAYINAIEGKQAGPHFEISFDNRKTFNKFVTKILNLKAIDD